MKTTKKSVLSNKTEKLADKKVIKRNSKIYEFLSQIENGAKKIRTVWVSGSSFKYSSLYDKTNELALILDMLKISYSIENDALRGGRTGQHINIITKIV